ncbi:MAG: ATP-binding cassette domain-containing protein [Erysipelotrichaceae bacterium]|nr:ATP-binding cassette domain-containing protein [Erysipelotrichaceae bacterium]
MINLKHINLNFDNNVLFDDADIFIPDIGFVSIFGHSGVGKTTLLKIIIDQLDVNNIEIIEMIDRNEIFYVDQFATLYNNMSIENHFKLVSEVYCVDYNKDNIKDILNDVGLEYISIDKLVKTLSVGERKRLSIALAISVDPRLLVIDEPTSSIDYDTKLSLLNLLKEISKERCVLITSHETDFNEMFDMIYRIKDCKIVQEKETVISITTQQYERKEIKPNLKQISKYKSKKDKRSLFILFVVIVIVLNMISFQQMSLYFTYQNTKHLTESMTDNSIYFTFHRIDTELISTDYDLNSYTNFGAIIDSDSIEEISQLDHVLEVKPYYQLRTTHYDYLRIYDETTSSVKIYDSDNNIINTLTLYGDAMSSQTPAVVAYYENQNITINGEKLDGNYIDETTAEQFGLTQDDFDNPITMTMEVSMPLCNIYCPSCQAGYSVNGSWNIETDPVYYVPFSEIVYDKKEITIEIEGIITDEDFEDYYNLDCEGLIYVNYEELQSIINENTTTDISGYDITLYDELDEVVMDYTPSNYIVLVDSIDNLDDVINEIENTNSRITTYSPYSYLDEMTSLRASSFNNNILLTIVYTLIAIVIIIILLYRYNSSQKNKIIFYSNIGLNKNEIFKILEYDIATILRPFIIINLLFFMIEMFYEGEFYGYDQLLLVGIFIIMSVLIAFIINCINRFILKRIIHE